MAVKLENIVGLYISDRKTATSLTALRQGYLTIGRAQDNTLVINEPTISAHHARIYTYLTVSYIEDLDSTNGTFVDGKRITKHLLKPGSVISLGGHELLLEDKPAVANNMAIAG